MIALLRATAIGQTEDVAELRVRWQIAQSLFSDELANYSKSYRKQYEAIQREPNEARKRELSVQSANPLGDLGGCRSRRLSVMLADILPGRYRP